MMSQTLCQLTLLSGGVASNWSTSYVHLYRYNCFVTYFLHIYPYILFGVNFSPVVWTVFFSSVVLFHHFLFHSVAAPWQKQNSILASSIEKRQSYTLCHYNRNIYVQLKAF